LKSEQKRAHFLTNFIINAHPTNNLDRILTCNFVVLGREGPEALELSLEEFRTVGFVPIGNSTRLEKVEVSTVYEADELQNEP